MEALIACHECDLLHQRVDISPGASASCRRCGALLYRHIGASLDRTIALYATSAMLLVMSNSTPFLGLEFGGRVERNHIVSSAYALFQMGMGEVGLLVLLTSVVFPLVVIAGMLYVLVPVRLGVAPPALGVVYRVVSAVMPWSLIGVFVLATLIAFVKLGDLATVLPGPGLYALAALLLAYTGARVSFAPEALWAALPNQPPPLSPGVRHWLNCHLCGALYPMRQAGRCLRCGSALHHRIENSLDRTLALCAAAAILLVPANLYPVMTVTQLGRGEPDTILSGVQKLIASGMWSLGMIVFIASIVVPVLKIGTLVFLAVSVRLRSRWRPRDRTLLYRLTEVVGAWSMVDVFLVGLLTGLVSLDILANIEPGIGATFFAAAVVLTMLAASHFDSRLIWDAAGTRP